MLSFKLFRKFHSPERDVLEREGVGGGFHFVYQTNEKEDGQLPTLLVMADRGTDNHLMTLWMVRVVRCEIGFVLEVLTPPGQLSVADSGKYRKIVSLDPLVEWSLPGQEGQLTAEQQNILQRSLDASANLPFYSCCVIGAIDPDYWSNTLTYFPEFQL